MLTLELPSHVEKMIVQTARQQGISVSELVLRSFQQHWAEKAYPQGDIRRLKGMVATAIHASMDEMNQAIVAGATDGER